jgi:hypothetical protein
VLSATFNRSIGVLSKIGQQKYYYIIISNAVPNEIANG